MSSLDRDPAVYRPIREALALLTPEQRGSQRLVVLLTTGAMNPVHRGHLRGLEAAAQVLRRAGAAVLGALLSPSADAYVRLKRLPMQFAAADRIELLHLAIEEEQFEHVRVECDPWEAQQQRFIDFPDVHSELQKYLDAHLADLLQGDRRVEVLYVCGLDHVERCGLWDERWVVCVTRGTGQHIPRRHACLVVEGEAGLLDASSTAIRDLLLLAPPPADLEAELARLTYPGVARRLLQLCPAPPGGPPAAGP